MQGWDGAQKEQRNPIGTLGNCWLETKLMDFELQKKQQLHFEDPKDFVLLLISREWASPLLTLCNKIWYLLSKFLRKIREKCREFRRGQLPKETEKFNYDTKKMP